MDGYGYRVEYASERLTIAATNRATKVALLGEDWERGEVTLDRSQIASAEYKPANLVRNGKLVVRSTDGKQYIAHFLRKHGTGFETLARQLGAAGV